MRLPLLLFVVLLLISRASAQAPSQGIPSPWKQAQVGKILFSTRAVTPSAASERDFIAHYELTYKSNLYFTAYLSKPLTAQMQALAPALPVDTLHRLSGYRFTLYLDGKPVYTSDIQGAPLPAIRDTETVLHKPLIDNAREGAWWTQFFWGRFLRNGGTDALTDGQHLMRLEIRPHVRDIIGEVIAAGDLVLTVNLHPKIDLSAVTLHPPTSYPGLAVSTAAFDRNKIRELKARIELAEFKKINSIIVIKEGKLLIEEYFNGASRTTLHNSRSVGKSFASTMTGIALQEGHIKSITQPLKDFYALQQYANYSPLKEQVTIRDLLTMNSVFDGDDNDGDSPGNEENMYPTDNWVKFTLDLPVTKTIPRGQWHYFTAGVMVLGDMLNQKVPGGLEAYTKQKLFDPLQIGKYEWTYTPQHVPSTAGGLQLAALDLAKYGQLYKNGGTWQGKQVVPKAWINQTFSKQIALPERAGEYYGLLFWNKQYTVNGKAYETYYCTGNGGNKVFVFTDQPLVIVVTASAYGMPYAHPQVDRIMNEFVLPAVLDVAGASK
ncbi:serine hydrolase domain-containing protein [Paraflavitalea pollutisoli]|uniref:serine hydrolase domain-containing protein n=1 Tax=Paraflavitalea pollutisoli TaxID=3034143 RepID=UPI0023EB4F8A|nr:serine hydrolase [Paraflavitalea sp. H1-2-19X]